MNKIFKKIIEIGFFILLYSCVSAPVKPKHNTPFPEKIALLPFDNMSVDIDASFIMENLLESYIDSAGFNLQDRKITYQRLNSIGISDGGQLSSLTTQELGKLLEADALIYGEVREFNNKNLGVYYSRTVEVSIKLIDSKTGEILFETVKRKSNSKLGLSKEAALDNLKTGYAQKAFETIMKSPLKQEADEVARMLAKELSKFRKEW
ncbi:MAG: GNA1162 family protein [Elusimicrobiota bacterium]